MLSKKSKILDLDLCRFCKSSALVTIRTAFQGLQALYRSEKLLFFNAAITQQFLDGGHTLVKGLGLVGKVIANHQHIRAR